jgi:DNA-binding transcriptional LysR family regulator
MDFRKLKIFSMVAETGNMTTAAARLYVSQPTISQTIAELEEHYKAKLFTRNPKGLCLTKIGKHLLAHAKTIIADFDLLESEMRHASSGDRLRIGASVTVARSVMPHLAAALKSRAPWIELYVAVETTRDIENKLLEGQIDAALVEGEIKSRFIAVEPVINDCLVLICGQAHPLANRESVDITELNDAVFILQKEGGSVRTLFESVMRQHALTYKIGCESSCTESIKQAVIRNQGLAILSARLVARELASREIHFVKNTDFMWKRHFYFARHKDKTQSESLTIFENLVRTCEKFGLSCPISESTLLNAVEKFHLIEC